MINNKGFSLVSVMVAAGLLGGLAIGVMQLFENINKGQNFAQSIADELDLRSEVNLILGNEKHCRISLAGEGDKGSPTTPVTFSKSNIDDATEGLDIELFLANQDGNARTLKKLSSSDVSKNKFGKLEINSVKLIMSNPTTPAGEDYLESTGHNDVGEIVVTFTKKLTSSTDRQLKISFPVNVGMMTNSSRETTILSCSKEVESDQGNYTYPQSCSLTLSHRDNGGAWRSSTTNLNSGGFAAVRLRGDVNGDDDFRITGSCGSGDELSSYFSGCELGLGWRDSTDTGNPVVANPLATKTSTSSFNGSVQINTDGDVNADDSFYYRVRCPSGADINLNDYVKRKCIICMGHTDRWYSSPEKASCKKVQDISDNSWGRIMTSGDVGADDALFLGFFCEGEFAPIIKSWSY